MNTKPRPSTLEIGIVVALLVLAGVFYAVHAMQPYSEPQMTVSALIRSANTADLAGFKSSSTPDYYGRFVRYFGEQKFQRITWIYQQVYQLGLPRWYEHRQRAQSAVDAEYQKLHQQVASLGQEAFNRLSPDARLDLMDNPQKRNDFIFESGIKALAAHDRQKIENVEDFKAYRDREQFMQREAWSLLSADDRRTLVDRSALSSVDTPAKLAFLDKVGIPQLSPAFKKQIQDIPRTDLNDPDVFRYKYGEPLAKDFFSQNRIPVAGSPEKCSFPREDFQGSLLRGEVANCEISLPAKNGSVNMKIDLQKVDFRWLVTGVTPNFYQTTW
jgi:hypothetical protein